MAIYNGACQYDLGNSNQLDWNKLMHISLFPNTDKTSVRIGWRWNISKNKMELGLYGHIQHTSNSNPGREFLYLTDVDLNTHFAAELILAGGGMGVIVGDKGSFIKRKDIFDAGTVKTRFKRSAYFGGQECPPHNMDITVTNIKGDDNKTNWHNGACDKTFSRSIFYNGENLTIYAARTITMSEQVYRGQYDSGSSNSFNNTIPSGYSSGDEIPWFESNGERFVKVESGANLTLFAGDGICLKSGFRAEAGSTFSAKLGQSMSCASFQYRMAATEEDSTDVITPLDSLVEQSEQLEIINDKTPITNNLNNKASVDEFSIIPNPNNGEFKILLSETPSSVSVVNPLGITVYENKHPESNELKINLKDVAKGLYIVKVNTKGKTSSKKIVID